MEEKTIYKGKKVAVIGLGVSGASAATVLSRLGAHVTAIDSGESPELSAVAASMRQKGIVVKLGPDVTGVSNDTDLVVVSPGVPADSPVLRQAEFAGISVFSEIEVAFSLTKAPMIAVTGTNGKTTVATLIGEMFMEAGVAYTVAGNIGRPLIEAAVSDRDSEVFIVEVSSFQLEHIERFRPHIGIILNISDDHMDRHCDLEEYLGLKMRLFKNQKREDFAVVNLDDAELAPATRLKNTTLVGYSRFSDASAGVFLREGAIIARLPGETAERRVGEITDMRMRGPHNEENVLASVAAASLWGLPAGPVMAAVRRFEGLPHRLELVAEIGGVMYFNDSKATNTGACLSAIKSFDRPLILIAGGRNKGLDFKEMAACMKERVKAAVLIGEAACEIASVIKEAGLDIPVIEVSDMEEAVAAGAGEARTGDIVLLSPACASFDMFSDYKERGRVFAEAVRRLERTDRTAAGG